MGGPSAPRKRGSPQVDRTDGWPPRPPRRLDRIPPTGRLTVTWLRTGPRHRYHRAERLDSLGFRNVASVDVVPDDEPRRRSSQWEPLELLALAGLAASAATIVVQGASGLAVHFARAPGVGGWSASVGIATGWTDTVAIVLLLVLGFAWATVSRWSDEMNDEECDSTEGSGQHDESPVVPVEDSPDPDSPAVTPDENTVVFDEASGHLARAHATLLSASVLLLVTLLGGALRVAAIVYQQQQANSPYLAANLLEELGSFFFVAIVAVFGFVVVARLVRLCHWWD